MRIPPSLQGHGGSQRAWHLVEGLRRLAPVHFVLVSRKLDADAASVSLEPLRPLVESVTSIDVAEWQPKDQRSLPAFARRLHTGWFDAAGMGSQEAPHLSKRAVGEIADRLPVAKVELIFAGRLPSAVIVDQLIAAGALAAPRKVVDFDDVMSRFRQRQLDQEMKGLQTRMLGRIDVGRIAVAEREVIDGWDAVSVCTDEDVATLQAGSPGRTIVKAPNVTTRPNLPQPQQDRPVRVLFIGNLGFRPNIQGLLVFLREAWPRVRRQEAVQLTVAGLNPTEEVARACREAGAELLPNVPDLEPLYARSHIVLAPILFGGGTRIKILEAMAYGRAVVSTSMGAEGLDLVSGEHALIADKMDAFADAIVRLARDPPLRERLSTAARRLQDARFGAGAMAGALERMAAGAA